MIGWPWVGLALALVVEAHHWVNVRWDFNDESIGRAWQFSVIAMVIAAAMIWMDGNRYTALPIFVSWMPLLLLPVQFVQSYGAESSVPLSEFSLLASHSRKRNERLGLSQESIRFHFGNVHFVVALIGATMGENAGSKGFLAAMIGLIGWRIFSTRRNLIIIPLLLVSGLLALTGEVALEKLSNLAGLGWTSEVSSIDPNFNFTMIGTRGTVIQSRDMVWRLRPAPKSPVPSLLRINSFNTFLGSNWRNTHASANDFKDLQTRPIGESICYSLRDSKATYPPSKPATFSLRGSVIDGSPLPLPGDAVELQNFDVQGMIKNPYGMVRVNPKFAVISGDVSWRAPSNPEEPPIMTEDLRIPESERETIRKVVANLHLDQAPDLRGKLAIIRAWFLNEFRYTLELTIRRPNFASNEATAMSQFLTNVKSGHCEYFATATALILREAGIPARYSTGFIVSEHDRKRGDFIIRGTHSHAWCRYWDPQSRLWQDFDTTPSNASTHFLENPSIIQQFNDWLKRIREDSFLWRNQESNRMRILYVMIAIGSIAAAVIIRKLWKSKRHISHQKKSTASTSLHFGQQTPLRDLEKQATKILGQRPIGFPYARWITKLRPMLPEPEMLDESIRLHQQIRFDPMPCPPACHERLAKLVKQMKIALKHAKKVS